MSKKTASVPLKLTPELKRDLKTEAKDQDRSVNWLATKYITDGLARDRDKRKRKG